MTESQDDSTAPTLQPFAVQRVVLLQTRKRDGTWVDTPVHIAVHGDRAFFRTPARAAKNKRLRNFPEVRFCSSTFRGVPTGPSLQAAARLLSGAESAAAGRLINRKYPVLQGVLVPLIHRAMRTETLHYELADVRSLPSSD